MRRRGLLGRAFLLSLGLWSLLLLALVILDQASNLRSPVYAPVPWWRALSEIPAGWLTMMTLGLPFTIWLLLGLFVPVCLALWIKDRQTRRNPR